MKKPEEKMEEKLEQLQKAFEQLKSMTSNELTAANRGKQLVGIRGEGDRRIVAGGPAMTGIPRNYQMGQTKSGKPIMSTDSNKGGAPYHANYEAEDHKDAYFAHGNQANELKRLRNQVHPDLVTYHENKAKEHWNAYQGLIQKKREQVT